MQPLRHRPPGTAGKNQKREWIITDLNQMMLNTAAKQTNAKCKQPLHILFFP